MLDGFVLKSDFFYRFRWVLAPTKFCDRLPPRDRSNSIVRLTEIKATWGLTIGLPASLTSLSDLVDMQIGQVPLSSNLFPGVPGNVMVHQGFRDAHSATAPTILAQVKSLISTKGATNVVAVSSTVSQFLQAMMLIDRDHS